MGDSTTPTNTEALAELRDKVASLLRLVEDHRQVSREAAAAYRALEAERDALRADAERWRFLLAQRPDSAPAADWERELSAVMPQDFKDWRENSRSEWPAVAAEVIRSLREDRDWWREAAGRAQRQPLTDAQIAEGRYRMWADELEDAPEPWAFLKGARWAERYYGIGGATTGEQR